ncbi:hypothetical protein [Streptomyces sp. NPDC005485]|uniref:hypothetical protein n=1 Tax=Streptomyces sp. NPDC005485 TaxID=3155591 RepID=UPI0033AC0700
MSERVKGYAPAKAWRWRGPRADSRKQPKLTARQQTHLVRQHQSGEHTIAELFSVSRAMVYRVFERHQNAPAPSTSAGQ